MQPGAVRLRVADLEGGRRFYEDAIGLRAIDVSSDLAALGVDGRAVVELARSPDAPPRPRRTTGLFHLAILVPSRRDLALALRRVVGAGWSLSGASDHLVSEALYLSDPEGNGIEIYRDRPREEWSYAHGQLRMETLPLDLDGLVGELDGGGSGRDEMAPETRIGHVHLNVADLEESERFYSGLLGLDVTVRGYPGALFLSSGGYHHHIGLNTWAGAGAPRPPPGSRGLRWFELLVPDAPGIDELERRLGDAGVDTAHDELGLRAFDPSGNGVLFRVGGPAR